MLARSLFKLGRIEQARTELQTLTRGAETKPVWHSLLGLTEERLGNLEAALAAASKAVEMDASNASWRQNLDKLRRQVAAANAPAFEVVPADAAEHMAAKQHWSRRGFDFYKGPRPWSRDMAEYLLRFSPRRVLEFGCNAGGNLEALRAAAPEVDAFGLDINPAALEHARAQGLACGLGDETTLETFPPRSFDVVFTISVIDHLPDPAPAIRAMLRLADKAVVLHEPWLGTEGRIARNRHRITGTIIETTPFSYSWDYERLARAHAPEWTLSMEAAPIPTNTGSYYFRYTLVRAASDLSSAPSDSPP